MINHPTVLGLAGVVFGLTAALAPTQAAVRLCSGFVVGSGAGPTEDDAKKAALDDWTAKVEALGLENARWWVATGRTMSCATTGGSHRCHARARPCIIRQVPPKPGTPDLRRVDLE